MKKMNFLKGVCFAAVALAATMFTSCTEENFEVNFEVNPAKVYIMPTVIDVATNADVTAKATISGTTELTGNKDIAATTAEFSVAVEGLPAQSFSVKVPAIPAGQVVTFTPTVRLHSAFQLVENGSAVAGLDEVVFIGQGESDHFGAMNHNGSSWFTNASEYLKDVTVDYTIKTGVSYLETKALVPSVALNDYIETLTDTEGEIEGNATFPVSAWSMFNFKVTYGFSTQKYDIISIATGDKVGEAETEEKSFTKIEMNEVAHPSHAGHYHYGHGHSDAANAGGGIVIAD